VWGFVVSIYFSALSGLTPGTGTGYKQSHHDPLLSAVSHIRVLLLWEAALWRK
jgi:hypothetical protein